MAISLTPKQAAALKAQPASQQEAFRRATNAQQTMLMNGYVILYDRANPPKEAAKIEYTDVVSYNPQTGATTTKQYQTTNPTAAGYVKPADLAFYQQQAADSQAIYQRNVAEQQRQAQAAEQARIANEQRMQQQQAEAAAKQAQAAALAEQQRQAQAEYERQLAESQRQQAIAAEQARIAREQLLQQQQAEIAARAAAEQQVREQQAAKQAEYEAQQPVAPVAPVAPVLTAQQQQALALGLPETATAAQIATAKNALGLSGAANLNQINAAKQKTALTEQQKINAQNAADQQFAYYKKQAEVYPGSPQPIKSKSDLGSVTKSSMPLVDAATGITYFPTADGWKQYKDTTATDYVAQAQLKMTIPELSGDSQPFTSPSGKVFYPLQKTYTGSQFNPNYQRPIQAESGWIQGSDPSSPNYVPNASSIYTANQRDYANNQISYVDPSAYKTNPYSGDTRTGGHSTYQSVNPYGPNYVKPGVVEGIAEEVRLSNERAKAYETKNLFEGGGGEALAEFDKLINNTIGWKTIATIVGSALGGPLGATFANAAAGAVAGESIEDIAKGAALTFALSYGTRALGEALNQTVSTGVDQGLVDADVGSSYLEGSAEFVGPPSELANYIPEAPIAPEFGGGEIFAPEVPSIPGTEYTGGQDLGGFYDTTPIQAPVQPPVAPLEPYPSETIWSDIQGAEVELPRNPNMLQTGGPVGSVQVGPAPAEFDNLLPINPDYSNIPNIDISGVGSTGEAVFPEIIVNGTIPGLTTGQIAALGGLTAAAAIVASSGIGGAAAAADSVLAATPSPGPGPSPVPQPPTPVEPVPQPPTPVEPVPQPPTPVEPVPQPPTPVEPVPQTPTPVEPIPVEPPPVTQPPVVEPPVTPAPVTPAPVEPVPQPPAPVEPVPVEPPPVTQPPVTQPPVVEPPVPIEPIPVEPPVVEPPVVEPPVPVEPPVVEPPVVEPPVVEPPAPVEPAPVPEKPPVEIIDKSAPYTGEYSNESVLQRFMNKTISYGDVAKLVAAGYVLPSVLGLIGGPPAAPGRRGYGPLAPIQWGTLEGGLTNPGLNPGFLTFGGSPPPAYQTTNPIQSQYYWGLQPYMQTQADLANYNQVQMPAVPFGRQQPRGPMDYQKFIRETIGTPEYQQAAMGASTQYPGGVAPATSYQGGVVAPAPMMPTPQFTTPVPTAQPMNTMAPQFNMPVAPVVPQVNMNFTPVTVPATLPEWAPGMYDINQPVAPYGTTPVPVKA